MATHPSMASMLVLAVLSLAGCSIAMRTSDTDVTTIELERLVTMLRQPNKKTVLIDVRQPAPFAQGHIPGALNIPINQIKSGDRGLSDTKIIIVYSAHLRDMLSRAASKKLIRLGYQNVYDFRGGLDAWKRQLRSSSDPYKD